MACLQCIFYRELLKPNGVLLKEGDIMKMPALSATLDKIADEGSQYFYNSSFTEQMVNELQGKYGAVLTVRDFNEYALEIRDSLISDYKDLQVIGVPPPASGAVNALVFNILQGAVKQPLVVVYYCVNTSALVLCIFFLRVFVYVDIESIFYQDSFVLQALHIPHLTACQG